MAPFHPLSSGTAARRTRERLMHLRTHGPSRSSVSDEDPPQPSTGHSSSPRTESNNTTRASRRSILSRLHVGPRDANEQLNSATNPGQTNGGMAEAAPLESEPGRSRSTQQTPQKSDTETALQPLSELVDELSSPDTPASPSGHNKNSSSDSIGHGANSYTSKLKSHRVGYTQRIQKYATLGADDPYLKQAVFFRALHDTGASVSMLSYEIACLIAPDIIRDNFANVDRLTFGNVGGEVTLRGPILLKFWLQNGDSRIYCEAPFYILPSIYRSSDVDALLNLEVLGMLGLN
jgi:hypothetical protein